jgi:hypothetical protein
MAKVGSISGPERNPMIRLIACLAAALALCACASVPTLYQPAAGPRSVGFSDMRIESDRYRITFRGGPGAPPEQVSDYALLRAADLALEQGYDWFRVTNRSMGRTGRDGGPRVSVGTGSASFGRHSAVGVGLGAGFDLGGGPSLVQTIEVLMGRGAPPRDPDVYVAREVRRSVGARI